MLSPALGLAVAGCVLGGGIATGGFFLANQQEAELLAREEAHVKERDRLTEALREARLTAPRLRLEELAGLALVPEFLDLAANDPGGVDAQELNTYLTTVLEAALDETGMAKLTLAGADGTELIAVNSPVSSPATDQAFSIKVPISDFYGSDAASGQLTGVIAAENITFLASPIPVETTASTGKQTGEGLPSEMGQSLADRIRLLGIAGGLAVAFFGIFSANLARRKPSEAS